MTKHKLKDTNHFFEYLADDMKEETKDDDEEDEGVSCQNATRFFNKIKDFDDRIDKIFNKIYGDKICPNDKQKKELEESYKLEKEKRNKYIDNIKVLTECCDGHKYLLS